MQKFRPAIYSPRAETLPGSCASVVSLGFDHLMLQADAVPKVLAADAHRNDLALLLCLSLDRPADNAHIFMDRPDWRPSSRAIDALPDPRDKLPAMNLGNPEVLAELAQWWTNRLLALSGEGAAGFCLQLDGPAPSRFFRDVIGGVRKSRPACRFLAWTPGAPSSRVTELWACGFDAAFTSSAWWDLKAPWFAEEAARLSVYPSTIALATLGDEKSLWLGALTADGLMVSGDLASGAGNASLSAALKLSRELSGSKNWAPIPINTGGVAALRLSHQHGGEPKELIWLVNSTAAQVMFDPAGLARLDGLALGKSYWPHDETGASPGQLKLAPGSAHLYMAEYTRPVTTGQRDARRTVEAAIKSPRIAIENISPCVDGGRFVAKRQVGQQLLVEADIFGEGHDMLAACLVWRAADEEVWQETPLEALANDRWQVKLPLLRVGRYQFQIEAWLDVFGAWRDEVTKKMWAGQTVSLELHEGRLLVEAALARAQSEDRVQLVRGLKTSLKRIDAAQDERCKANAMLELELLCFMTRADVRAFKVRTPVFQVDAERRAAGFSSWYELFPRSLGADSSTHGSFSDVIPRLPAIRDMGFDTLYFPPIHPIGLKHRKGKNNTLTAEAHEPGSPYAIGSEDGGHDAIHPELGTFDDFRALRDAAAAHGLELALDFAIQCSPDHPWLKQHPEWFLWRPDGSIRYAENPPKKYQDIVNVDFYAPGATPRLWIALRNIVLFWVEQGVKVFRVDNPHTKPLPFWEWMITEVRSRNPEVIFLAEAFTRPKPMYRLAKAGFSQSYTYFTWRHGKQEFIDYLTELTQGEPRDFFRPHFFVNTPDINPYFLQRSGRAGFVIRAALAATLSGLWGMYSGFELCEAEPVPGKEEYLDSEKYELRKRDWTHPGNIVREITLLNRIRQANPALQSHLGVQFCKSTGDDILCFIKTSPAADGSASNPVLVAICLDPHRAHECDIELPLEALGLSDGAPLQVEDLVHGNSFSLDSRHQRLQLDPNNLAFLIWRLAPQGAS